MFAWTHAPYAAICGALGRGGGRGAAPSGGGEAREAETRAGATGARGAARTVAERACDAHLVALDITRVVTDAVLSAVGTARALILARAGARRRLAIDYVPRVAEETSGARARRVCFSFAESFSAADARAFSVFG